MSFHVGDWIISINSVFSIFIAVIAISLLVRFAGLILRGLKRFFRFLARPFKRSRNRNKWNEARDRIYQDAAAKDLDREKRKADLQNSA